MRNKIIVVIILFCICIVCGIIILINKNGNKEQNISNNKTLNNITETSNTIYTNTTNIESENKLISNIKVIINGKTYNAKIEDNEAGQSFANTIPQEYNMSELNGNEKYIYLDNDLPTNSYNPKHIESGDIMLFGNNCLVIFYKSFDTSYSYTKIGHVENISDLGNKNVTVKFEKIEQ